MTTAVGNATMRSPPLRVQDALVLMQQAVRSGELQQAASIGATAVVPLNVRIEDLSLLGEIASGAEATVLYGTLNNNDVAVKRFKMHHSDDIKRFRRELSILASLDPHPNIVPLLGARALPPDYLLIMPLASNTLHGRLYHLGWRPTPVELLQLAVQAAEAVAAVHAKGFVHRDIKPSNLLMSYEGQLWLADFGLAASVDEVVQESTLSIGMLRSRGKPTGGFLKRAMQGTLEYMAPEVLQKQPASHASDVYALAITINELATGVYPFSDCTKDNPEIHTVLEHGYGRQELATAVAAEGLRPSLPKGPAVAAAAIPGFVELLEAAWQLDPAKRLTAEQLRDGLAALLQQQQGLAAADSQCQQQQIPALLQRQQQELGIVHHSCYYSSSEENSNSAMELDEQQAGATSSPGSSSASDVSVQDSKTLASSTLSLLGSKNLLQQQQQQQQQGFGSSRSRLGAGRLPHASHSSISTVSTEVTGFNSTAEVAAAKPLSTEAANAAAAAAAAAAVPAALSLQGVLSLTAAADVSRAAAAAAEGQQQHQQLPVIEAGAFGALGPRESMEDRYVVVQGLGGDARVTLAAVFDGHRGAEAAAYAAAQLPRNLLLASVHIGSSTAAAAAGDQTSQASQASQASPSSSSSNGVGVTGAASEQPAADDSSAAAAALKQAFLSTDAAFWQEWQAEKHAHAVVGQYNERYPGCTALAAVVAGAQLFVANAGDGRAVLSRGGTAVPLSRQHTADLEDERARVLAAGGTVQYRGGSWRVGPAALQVTRALGDFDLKKPAQQQQQQQRPGQLSGPACLMGARSPYHHQSGLVMTNPGSSSSSSSGSMTNPSCNGMTNPSSSSSSGAMTNPGMPVTAEPEVVSLQLTATDQFLILGTDGLWDVMKDQEAVGLVHDTVKDPALCAKRLVQEALSRGSSDNVSAVVVFLQPKHTLERVWMRSVGQAVPAATMTFYGSRRVTTPQLQQQTGVDGPARPAGVADEMMDTY